MLPIGTYRVKAVASGIGVSNTKSTPYTRVTLRVLDGAEQGQEIDWLAYVTPKTEERLAIDMRTLGFQGNDLEVLHNRNEEEVAQLLPNVVSIVVEHEEWQGSTRERVRWINPDKREAGSGSLFAGMKAAFAALDQGAKKKPAGGAIPRPAAPPPAEREIDDSDVPFLARSPGDLAPEASAPAPARGSGRWRHPRWTISRRPSSKSPKT